MSDVVFVLIVVAFFASAALYVRVCAALVGHEAADAVAAVDGDDAAAA